MENGKYLILSHANKQCCQRTKKGVPCLIGADRNYFGKWYCHVHDPAGRFQQQQDEREWSKAISLWNDP